MRRQLHMRRYLMAAFEDPHDAAEAALECKSSGMQVVDVYGPHPVHGIDGALGLRRSRLTWVCFLAGLGGFSLALLFQYWSSAVDWPINVGGKPFDSLPAFIPVAFEMTVLLAGLTTVAAFLVRSGLHPWRDPRAPHPGVTDDRFVVVVRDLGRTGDLSRAGDVWRHHGAFETWEVVLP